MKFPEFRLNEFRDIAKWLRKKFPGPVAYFLIGWLWGLEDIWIDAKVDAAIETAIAPHKPSEPELVAPEYWSEPSEVEGLDIIGYTYHFSDPCPPHTESNNARTPSSSTPPSS